MSSEYMSCIHITVSVLPFEEVEKFSRCVQALHIKRLTLSMTANEAVLAMTIIGPKMKDTVNRSIPISRKKVTGR